jgi:hypothetical protein
MLAIGTALFVVADVVYDRLVLAGNYSGGDPVDILYVLAVLAFALGAASRRQVVGASRGAAALRPVTSPSSLTSRSARSSDC